MGLDMYLVGHRFFWYTEEQIKAGIRDVIGECPGPIRSVDVEAAYWRKANHIHLWFVTNVQGGTDDCHTYDVSIKQLVKLRNLCIEVLANPSEGPVLLPTQSGFFFGGIDYGEKYIKDLEYTRDKLTELIGSNINKYKEWSYQYHSSW
jgi:hypothetical protein